MSTYVTLKSIANKPDIHEGISRAEIDTAIARHADTETLYDQPYEDNKRVRVSGPHTMESLSPHCFVSLDEEKPAAEKSAQKDDSAGQFEAMIIENLKKARETGRHGFYLLVLTLWTLHYFSSISAMGAFFLTDSIPALALSFDL